MLSHAGGIAPPGRDEAAGTKADGPIKSKKSLQKTVMAGRHPHRVVRYHGRIGFTRHQRELLSLEGDEGPFLSGEEPRGFIDVVDRRPAGMPRYRLIVRGDRRCHAVKHLLDRP